MITPTVSLLGKLTYSKTHWLPVLCLGKGGMGGAGGDRCSCRNICPGSRITGDTVPLHSVKAD